LTLPSGTRRSWDAVLIRSETDPRHFPELWEVRPCCNLGAGDHRPARSLSNQEAELDTTGALLTESQWAGVVVMLLHEDCTDILGSAVALNRDWLWEARRKGIEPSEVAIWLGDEAM